jgi:hypothetical protein
MLLPKSAIFALLAGLTTCVYASESFVRVRKNNLETPLYFIDFDTSMTSSVNGDMLTIFDREGELYVHMNTGLSPDFMYFSGRGLPYTVQCRNDCLSEGEIIHYNGDALDLQTFDGICCSTLPLIDYSETFNAFISAEEN